MVTYPFETFLPLHLRGILERGDAEGTISFFNGTCLFADVSGFTQLSEKLAGMGREGSEQLTRVLNSFYDTMVGEILSHQGDIIKFAGDAMTVFFDEPQSLPRAKTCSLKMQELIGNFSTIQTPVGICSLKMKIGLADGDCIGSIVGDRETADFLFAGPIVDQAAEAEHHASAGDIIEYDHARFSPVTEASPVAAVPPASVPVAPREALHRFIPHEIIEKLSSGGRSFANEHRRAVVLFVSFAREKGDVSYRDVEWLQAFYRSCLQITRRYDGYINKIDMGDKGAKLIIVYGAPVAHENDPDRAVATALEIGKTAKEQGLVTKIGINQDFIFSGIVGSTQRCEYTVMGDGVNLSARLMTAAPDHGVLVHTRMLKNMQRSCRWQHLAPIMVKGKSEPQPIAQCIEIDEGGSSLQQPPFFCARTQELARITKHVDDCQPNKANLVVVTGEQGIGKSALMAHILATLQGKPRVVIGVCHDYTKNTTYYPWLQLLRELIHTHAHDVSAPSTIVADIIQREEPALLPYLSIFGHFIAQEPLESSVALIDAETQKNILWKIIRILIDFSGRSGDLVCVFENGQWMDDLSRQLLDSVLLSIETSSPLFLVVSREKWQSAALPAQIEHIHLEPFSREEAGHFAITFLGVRELPGKVLDKLMQMSSGNPQVMAEVLRSFIDNGFVERSAEYPDLLVVNDLALTGIPETLDAMVMSRFDRLPSKIRRFLRLMAVFGEEIPGQLIPALFERNDLEEENIIRDPAVSSFIVLESEKLTLRFTQPYIRTVIYESVDFATRRELHRELGSICREQLPQDFHYYNEILAYHYSQADDAASAIPYLDIIVRKSMRNNAFSVAVEQFERLIRFQLAVGMEREAAANRCSMADLLIKLGDFDAASIILEELRMTPILEPDQLALVYSMFGDIRQLRGQFDEAISFFELTTSITENRLIELKAARSIGALFARQGNISRAVSHFQSLLDEFRDVSNHPEYAGLLMNLGIASFYTGSPSMKLFHQALQIFRKNSDILNELKLLNNLGKIEEARGGYSKSLNYYSAAFETASTFGFNQVLNSILTNLGVAHFHLMNLEESRNYYQKSYSYSSRFNRDPNILILIQCNLAEMRSYLNDYDGAMELYNQVRLMIRQHDFEHISGLSDYGLFLYRLNDRPRIIDLLAEIEDILTGEPEPLMRAAIDFMKAVVATEPHARETMLHKVQSYAHENNIHIYSFFSTVELLNSFIDVNPAAAKQEFERLVSLRTPRASMFNIITDFYRLRLDGSISLIRKLDRLFIEKPWPELSWQRHLRIGEWYHRHGKDAAARKRIKTALGELAAILRTVGTQTIRDALATSRTVSELRSLAGKLSVYADMVI